ncbi:MAG: GAF domain-containing protein [Gammaproteobacteria bacterium]|nr:GAF domain-containing protein [Gammaproteobacteria bacterium]
MSITEFKDRVNSLLSRGTQELSMSLGVLAQIENNSYEIYAVHSNTGAYVPGEKYALGDSYSREVIEKQTTIAEACIASSPAPLHHPLYRSLPLESYIGAPIVIDRKPWGCVDFSSMAQRDEPFGEAEIEMVESLARELSQLIGEIE